MDQLLKGISALEPSELARRLRRYLAVRRGHATADEVALARELLRRARRAAAEQLVLPRRRA